ncbi:MAG: hypothetical protein CMJ18_09530 [Phycisphaeraceae bacterium]|nr:hypothetical protein [Phycisphaeraceae bacterium]
MQSLRTRLLAGILSSMALLLIVFGVTIYVSIRNALMHEFRDALRVTVETLIASTEIEDGEVLIEVDPAMLGAAGGASAATWFQFWLADGAVLMRSESLGDRDLPRPEGDLKSLRMTPIDLPDGAVGQAAAARFVPECDDDLALGGAEDTDDPVAVTLVVARSIESVRRRTSRLAWLLLGAGAILMAAASGMTIVIVRRSLAPIDTLAGQIASMSPDDLGTRLAAANLPSEVEPVVQRLNAMLDRLQTAFDRERAFTGNVAHELRTPLSGIRSTIEVALLAERTPEDYRQTLDDTMDIVRHMHGMIEILILLARLDAGQIRFTLEPIELGELIGICWDAVRASDDGPRHDFANDVPGDLTCRSDRQWLSMVLTNLFENARAYVDDGGRIWAAGRAANGQVEIEIGNTGCRMTADEARHAFDRFWRADTSRADTGVHYGLGLSLVERLIAALEGTVECTVGGEGVFVVRLRVPSR